MSLLSSLPATRMAIAAAAAVVLALCAGTARAAPMGYLELPPKGGDGPVSVYYPVADGTPERPGPLGLALAFDAPPRRGNERLIVISHGSGGSPWVYGTLARALVEAGYIVALPSHHADNYRDPSEPGPASWKRRPAEVSRAIDVIGLAPQFAPLLRLDRVGVYGMSAGGHTALTLAGARWSPSRFRDHCERHLAEDFPACVGLATELKGNGLDGLKQWVARRVLRARFDDTTLYGHTDPRIAAVVAAVPAAADFEMSSFAHPVVPLALLTARRDLWLNPRFHSDRVLVACPPCERLADLADGGHGAYLSPPPSDLSGPEARLLSDPPGFQRGELAEVDQRVVRWFDLKLGPADRVQR